MRHKSHPVRIESIESGPHRARVFCVKCQQWVKWATEVDYLLFDNYIKEAVKYNQLDQKLRSAKSRVLRSHTDK